MPATRHSRGLLAGRSMEGTLFFYVVRTGCAWRLQKDFAPWPTVYWYFTWWHDDGTVERLHPR
ncbi:transposase [Streptomyces sp. NBC_01761]|uniref:transposase n=1 Tax=Streptomyces sp. NBC_01761 TaxID=2975932 RepID=UPI003FA38604